MLGLGGDPDRLAAAGARVLGQVDDLVDRGDRVEPVEGGVAGRTFGSRSFARSVRSSARVKSSVNQPVWLRRRRSSSSSGPRTPGGRRRRWSRRCCSRAGRRAGRPWSTPRRARCSRRTAGWRARSWPGCARAGSRWRRGARSAGRRGVGPDLREPDDDHLGVVRACPASGRVVRVVVVVGEQVAPAGQRDDRLDRLEGEGEGRADPVRARRVVVADPLAGWRSSAGRRRGACGRSRPRRRFRSTR